MKGKNVFSKEEAEVIKQLISEKQTIATDNKKNIRQKIRNIGFYYSDFGNVSTGYTVSDFENLIRSGQIQITPASSKSIYNNKLVDTPNKKTITSHINIIVPQKIKGVQQILDVFRTNRFNPRIDNYNKIPDSPGNYIICLRRGSKLPSTTIKPTISLFERLQVIYTGIAGTSLRNRDYKQHFIGNNAGRSTLRKSLGVLMLFQQIPRDNDPETGKTKFKLVDEERLTNWMSENLVIYFLPNSDFYNIEKILIKKFNPPLNIKDNNNIVNLEFRKLLSEFRSKK